MLAAGGSNQPHTAEHAAHAEHEGHEAPAAAASSRFARRLRVVTEPKHSNKMHRTRTLSELILLSPRSGPRVTPRRGRLDMDIEVSSLFADGEGVVDLFGARRSRTGGSTRSLDDAAVGTASTIFEDRALLPSAGHSNNQEEDEDEHMEVDSEDVAPSATLEPEPEAEPSETQHSVGEVVDMLFEIHTALKSRHLGARTAASALAASNLVSSVAFPPADPVPRDEQLEALENTRKMLECAICQEVFTGATEATCCGQIFCKDCIERWVSERGSCPMCRENIGFALLVASRHAQRMANEMKVSCPYCAEVMKKAGLSDHLAACDMAPVEPPPPADVALRQLLVATARLNVDFLRRFLLAPAPPQALMMQCYIRTRGGGNYELYTQDTDALLCTAVRRRQYDMSVSFSIYATGSADAPSSAVNSANGAANTNQLTQVARLEKNYMGSQYTMFDTTGETPRELGAVQYAATFGKSPRQMRVALPLVAELPEVDSSVDGAPSWQIQPWTAAHKDDTILAQVEAPEPSRALHLINKPPVWIESLEAYCLDFGGRVAAASVKNFLLSHPEDMDKTLMLFGRTQDRQVYSMDFAHPFSAVQAFAIALSSMDSHLVTFD